MKVANRLLRLGTAREEHIHGLRSQSRTQMPRNRLCGQKKAAHERLTQFRPRGDVIHGSDDRVTAHIWMEWKERECPLVSVYDPSGRFARLQPAENAFIHRKAA